VSARYLATLIAEEEGGPTRDFKEEVCPFLLSAGLDGVEDFACRTWVPCHLGEPASSTTGVQRSLLAQVKRAEKTHCTGYGLSAKLAVFHSQESVTGGNQLSKSKECSCLTYFSH